MWDEEQVEAAIDETARQMTAGEPGAGFRVRVMARLGNRPRVTRLWRPAFAGLAVAALILVAVMVRLPPSPHGGYGVPGKPDPTYPPGPAPAPIVQVPPSPLSNWYEQTVRLPPSPPSGYGAPGKPDPTYERDVDAVALPPIDLEPIAVAALPAGESIHVEPLQAAAPIAVAPLSTEIEGDPR